MGLALRAADLVVSRAGAAILGEFPAFGVPSVLVPYPHAWRYQKVNADYLVSAGAAVRLDDQDLSAELLPTIIRLMADATKLDEMRTAARALDRPGAARQLADLLAGLARPEARIHSVPPRPLSAREE
jgi:UDP-N-acetylglucosamine--N-acetylmuramyl-(pentapeptide) pyrophosphoryl-undecaprenol N-acetylglucosamine transferase